LQDVDERSNGPPDLGVKELCSGEPEASASDSMERGLLEFFLSPQESGSRATALT